MKISAALLLVVAIVCIAQQDNSPTNSKQNELLASFPKLVYMTPKEPDAVQVLNERDSLTNHIKTGSIILKKNLDFNDLNSQNLLDLTALSFLSGHINIKS